MGTGFAPEHGGSIRCGPADVWDADTGRMRCLLGPGVVLDPVLLLPDAALVRAYTAPGEVRLVLVEVPSGRLIDLPGDVPAAVSPDYRTLAVTDSEDGRPIVRLLDTAARRPLGTLRGLQGAPLLPGEGWPLCSVHRARSALVFSPDGRHLACCEPVDGPGIDTRILVWDVEGQGPAVVMAVAKDYWTPVAVGPGGRSIVLRTGMKFMWGGCGQFKYRRYELGRDEPAWAATSMHDLAAVRGASVLAAGRRAGGEARDVVWLWSAEGRPPGREVLLPDGEELFWSGGDWISPDGRLVLTDRRVSPVVPAPLRWLRDAGLPLPIYDGVIARTRMVEAESGRVILELTNAGGPYVFSSDGRLLAVEEVNGVEVWDVPPRKPLVWFLPLAAALALPPAWLARRRVARLRRLPEPPSG
jgi:hypothetical protein